MAKIILKNRMDLRKMLTSDVEEMSNSAVAKADLAKNNFGKYFIRAVIAGFYIVVATILSNVSAAVLFPTYPQFGKLLGAFLFSIAIILIVFIGGELFTGNNMTMAMGVYNKSCKCKDMVRVWIYSYIGNFAGAFIIGIIFIGSGASKGILTDYYNSFVMAKLTAEPVQLLLRGILCNFMVCLAVLAGTRMKSESGKLIVMFLVIMTFVVSGMEHCIANMGIFTLAYFLMGGLPLHLVAINMICVTIGNIIGGSILLALPLKLMSTDQ